MEKISVQVNIMGVTERLSISAVLQKTTGGRLFIDKGRIGSWWNAKRAWSHHNNKTHVLVLQDDIELCNNFMEHVEKTVRVNPDKIITYFTGPWYARARKGAVDRKLHWFRLQAVVTAQAILMPADMVADFLAWDAANMLQKPMHDDPHLRAWQIKHGIDTWCTVPELIEHIGAASSVVWKGPATMRHRSIGFVKDLPLDTDWTLGADWTYIHPMKMHHKLWTRWNEKNKS